MLNKLNYQYMLSYFGLIPYLFILIDKFFFHQIKDEIIINFSIYYTLLIFVFIGSMNWNFNKKLNFKIVIFGFFPSLISTIIIILNLYHFNSSILLLILIIFLLLQLILEYFILYSLTTYIHNYYLIRLPLTLSIVTVLAIIVY